MPKHSMRIAPRPTANAQTLLRIPEVLAKKQEGKSTQQIADEMGLNIGQIHAIMKTRDYNELFLDTINQQIAEEQEFIDAVKRDIKQSLIQFLSDRGHGKSSTLKTLVKHIRDTCPDVTFKVFDVSQTWYGSSPTKYRQLVTVEGLRTGRNRIIDDCVYEMGNLTPDQRRAFVATVIQRDYAHRYAVKAGIVGGRSFENLPWVVYVFEEANTYFSSYSMTTKDAASQALKDFVSVGRNFKMGAFLVATAEEGEISPALRNRSRHIYGKLIAKGDISRVKGASKEMAKYLSTEVPRFSFVYWGERFYGPVRIPDVVKSPAEDYVAVVESSGEPSWWSQFWVGFAVTLFGAVMLLKYFHIL